MSERSDPEWRSLLLGLTFATLLAAGGACQLGSDGLPGNRQTLSSAMATERAETPRDIASPLPARLLASLSHEGAPQLQLDVKAKDLDKFRKRRAEAAAKQEPLEDEEFNAKLRQGGRKLKVRVQLLGAGPGDDPLGDRAVYRVSVRGGKSLLGIRRFSLRPLDATTTQRESVFLDFLRSEGILAPRYFVVDLSVNGKAVGRRVLEEHFSTELLESQHRRDGVIFRFDEVGAAPRPDGWRSAPLDAYRSGKISKSPLLSAQRDVGFGLVRGLAEGRLSAAQALDLDTWAGFLAACEIWSTARLSDWDALRMYVNPFTLRLEPIAFDPREQTSDAAGFRCVGGRHEMMTSLLADPALRRAFLQRLHDMARRVESSEFEGWMRQREDQVLPLLREASPKLGRLSVDALRERARTMRGVDAENFAGQLAPAPAPTAATQTHAKSPQAVRALSKPALPESSLEEALASHPFLSLEPAASGELRWLRVAPGRHDVAGTLVLPSDTGLRIGAGTTLRFSPKQFLLARGPLEFVGTLEAPVTLESREDRWSGVVMLGSRHPSVWKHVIVRDTEAAERNAWQLTGAVTFRRTRLTLEHCRFEDSIAEDALNAVRSEVAILDIQVARSPSDAVDCDFCVGSIRGGNISQIGGDGLDAAGSDLVIDDVSLHSLGDKAVSVGEGSQVRINGVKAVDCGAGVASKDDSLTIVKNSSFEGVRVAGLMAYTKKDAYGPARLEARNVTISGEGRSALAQLGSVITIDGVTVKSEALDVDSLYAAPAATAP